MKSYIISLAIILQYPELGELHTIQSHFVMHHSFTTHIWCLHLLHHLPTMLFTLRYLSFRLGLLFLVCVFVLNKDETRRRPRKHCSTSKKDKKWLKKTAQICCKYEENHCIFGTKEVSLRLDNKHHSETFYDKGEILWNKRHIPWCHSAQNCVHAQSTVNKYSTKYNM